MRIAPVRKADIFDLVLAGRTAVVQRVEQDLEGRLHVAVVVEDDPGISLGRQGKMGHVFFFSPDELRPLEKGEVA